MSVTPGQDKTKQESRYNGRLGGRDDNVRGGKLLIDIRQELRERNSHFDKDFISKSRKMLQWLVVVTSYIKVAHYYKALHLFVIQSWDHPICVTQNQSRFILITRCNTNIRVCIKYI